MACPCDIEKAKSVTLLLQSSHVTQQKEGIPDLRPVRLNETRSWTRDAFALDHKIGRRPRTGNAPIAAARGRVVLPVQACLINVDVQRRLTCNLQTGLTTVFVMRQLTVVCIVVLSESTLITSCIPCSSTILLLPSFTSPESEPALSIMFSDLQQCEALAQQLYEELQEKIETENDALTDKIPPTTSQGDDSKIADHPEAGNALISPPRVPDRIRGETARIKKLPPPVPPKKLIAPARPGRDPPPSPPDCNQRRANRAKSLLETEFGDPANLDLTLSVGHAHSTSMIPMPISRPANANSMAVNVDTADGYRPTPQAYPATSSRWWLSLHGLKSRRILSTYPKTRERIRSNPLRSNEVRPLNGDIQCPVIGYQQSRDTSVCEQKGCHREIPAQPGIHSIDRTLYGYYGPTSDLTPSNVIDQERIRHIVDSWNNSRWYLAEGYLRAFHKVLIDRQEIMCARRVQHLLAVCASFRGDWNKATIRFIACLRTPINCLQELDDGDRAAACWLGDLYAMENRRADAGIAYLLAKESSLADSGLPYRPNLCTEREAVQLETYESTASEHNTISSSTMLEPGVISGEVSRVCIARIQSEGAKLLLDRQRSYGSIIKSDHSSALRSDPLNYRAMRVSAESFLDDSPWPMPYDPFFSIANVQRGRLIDHEGRIVVVPGTASGLKLPRLRGVHTLDCFVCSDLVWLIGALRKCLKTLEIDHAVRISSTVR